jgi:F420 biosynthesis protein FbiB-like protein
MNVLEAIARRRSIRKFRAKPVPEDTIAKVLSAACQAPSGKNRQPWRFIVVREDERREMVRIMRAAIEGLKAQEVDTGSSEWTAEIMEQAPVTIFVFNAFEEHADRERPSIMNVVDVQSIGAAIQNLLLAAQEYGLGTLWICDVFYAYRELCTWLGETHQMIAAVAMGYPDEQPAARPRKRLDEITAWR